MQGISGSNLAGAASYLASVSSPGATAPSSAPVEPRAESDVFSAAPAAEAAGLRASVPAPSTPAASPSSTPASQATNVTAALVGGAPGVALAASGAPEAAPGNPSPFLTDLVESPRFLSLDRGVRELAVRCLAFLDAHDAPEVRAATSAMLRERGIESDGDGRRTLTGIATSDGFGALPVPEQKKMLICLCGAGSAHTVLAFAAEKMRTLPPDQQAAMLGKMSTDLPLPTRIEAPARFSMEGNPVLDYGEQPYLVPGSTPGAQDTRMGRTYSVTLGGKAIPIVIPVDAPADPRLKVPTLSQVVLGLAALPPELLGGISGVAVCPTRKASPLGGDSAAVADSGPTGMLRLFPNADWDTGLVDATLVHEAGHVLSNQAWGKAGRTFRDASPTPAWAEWRQAMAEDGIAASGYARTAPTEDLSETLRAWSLVRGTPLEDDLRALMPHRFALVDGLVSSWVRE